RVAAAIRGIAMRIEPVEDDLQRGLRRNRSSDNDAVAVDRIDDRAGIAIRERSRSSGRVARAARITVGDLRAVTRVVHIDAIATIATNIPQCAETRAESLVVGYFIAGCVGRILLVVANAEVDVETRVDVPLVVREDAGRIEVIAGRGDEDRTIDDARIRIEVAIRRRITRQEVRRAGARDGVV